MTLETEKRNEIDNWIDVICEDRIDASGMARLNALLKDDEQAQLYYLRQIDLFQALRWHVTSQATWQSLGELKQAGFNPAALAKPQRTSARATAHWGWWVAVAAAVLVVFGLMRGDSTPQAPRPEVAERLPTPGPHEEAAPKLAGPVLASVIGSHDAQWQGLTDPRALPAGKFQLKRGLVRLKLTNEVTLSLAGPADVTLIDPTRCKLDRGLMTVAVPPWAQGFAVDAAGVKIIDLGTEFGVSVDADRRTKVTVFRGEVEAKVDSEFLGMVQTVRLTRKEGMEVDPQGAVTTSIIGDDRRFAALRQLPELTVPTVANGSFEYPRTNSYTTAAAAGWKLLSHPVANADRMQARAGILESGNQDVFAGQAPEAAHGRQWAYLTATTFDDGRTAFSSMHQSVGLVAAEATYRLRFSATLPEGQAPVDYTVGLYAGSDTDGPVVPIQVWRTPVGLTPGKPAKVTLTHVSPKRTSHRGDVLFVMFQAVPRDTPGECQVLLDNVQLELIDNPTSQAN